MARRKTNKQVKAMMDGVNRHKCGDSYENTAHQWLIQQPLQRTIKIYGNGVSIINIKI